MAMAPSDLGSCGLQRFGQDFPELELKDGKILDFVVDRSSDSMSVHHNSVCKVRINVKVGANDRNQIKLSAQNLPPSVRSAYIVSVDEAERS